MLKDVLNSTITPVRGQLEPFRISGVSRFSAQNTLNRPFTNVGGQKLSVALWSAPSWSDTDWLSCVLAQL